MNVLNTSNDEVVECPLCMEPLEVDDLTFFPCTCGYQICRFCWHRIRTDENELCPACRKAYPENPADFTPLSQEQISALKAEKRQRDQQRKQKITENRKHLANVRVVQKNLVFVVGLPPRLADADILKKHEYFGKYGKIHKVVINPNTAYAGVQGPSASAYVTYVNNNDALKAIQSVNNIMIDGRPIKTSLGTTKYCSHFMKNQQCPKADCMYLHELGDSEASFTKEEMHQGKHQDYEKRLQEALLASSNGSLTTNSKNGDNKLENNMNSAQIKEAWPSLSTSPVNKDISKGNCKENGIKSDNRKHDKVKGERKGQKTQKVQNISPNLNSKDNSNISLNGSLIGSQSGSKDTIITSDDSLSENEKYNNKQKHINTDDDIKYIEDIEKDVGNDDSDGKNSDTRSVSSSSSSNSGDSASLSEMTSGKSSPGSFQDHHLSSVPDSHSSASTTDSIDKKNLNNKFTPTLNMSNEHLTDTTLINNIRNDMNHNTKKCSTNIMDTSSCLSKLSLFDDNNSFFSSSSLQPIIKGKLNCDNRSTINNQINNTVTSHLPDLLNGTSTTNTDSKRSSLVETKLNTLNGIDNFSNQNSSFSMNGCSIENSDKYLSSLNTNEDWEAAFKYVLIKNKQIEDQQGEYMRMQEIHKRNNLINNMGVGPQINGLNDCNPIEYIHNSDPNRMSQLAQFQQQRQNTNHHNEHGIPNNMYGTNMSKFFDFHKNQQQQHQQFMINGHSNNQNERDQLNMTTNLLENNRINSQYIDPPKGMIGQQLQKQRCLNKFDHMGSHNPNILMNNNNQVNRMHNPYTQNSSVDDDLGFDPFIETQKALAELMENELLPQSQNNHSKQMLENCQRTRMPPPGFNHMNAFGFGIPRAQNSKILSYMNTTQQTPPHNNWSQHIGYQQPPAPQLNDHNHISQQNGSSQHNKNGYGNMSDWTTMDPAILSFRQFPSYSSHQHMQHNTPTPDMFMQHLSQQNIQQPGQNYGHPGMNLQNNLINQQQNSTPQVNYTHSNWLNSEQNMFMNSLTNGCSSNYEKFSIPMPPGIH